MVEAAGYVPRRVARLPSWLLANTTRLGHRLVAAHLSGDPAGGERLRRQHYLVLAGLAELDAPAQAELGRLLRVDGGDLVGILNDLELAGYVRRRPSATDRRSKSVSVTSSGQRALLRLDKAVEAANEELLSCLTPLERELLVSMLIRILLNAQAPTAPDQEVSGTRTRKS